MKFIKNIFAFIVLLPLALAACEQSSLQSTYQSEPEEDFEQEETVDNEIYSSSADSAILSDGMKFQIRDVIRPATSLLEENEMLFFPGEGEGSILKPPNAGQGEEYILIDARLSCTKSKDNGLCDDDAACELGPFRVYLVGSSGKEYQLLEMTGKISSLTLNFEGEVVGGCFGWSGNLPFLINSDEQDLVLVYEPSGPGNKVYFEIPSN